MADLTGKTVLVLSFHMLASRNFFTTDVFPTLVQTGVNLVVLVPAYKKDFFDEQYGRERVSFEGVDEKQLGVFTKLAYRLFTWLALCSLPTDTMRLRQRETLAQRKSIIEWLKYFASRSIASTVAHVAVWRQLVRRLDSFFVQKHFMARYREIAGKHQPDAVLSTDVFHPTETLFLQAARADGLFSIGMIRSWDNNTSKGLLRALPDRLIVNTEILAEEATRLHDYPRNHIYVSGIPQYDLMFRKQQTSRGFFFEGIGADPGRRLILFAPAGILLSDTDWQICELLKRAIQEGALPDDLVILVRSHPGDPADLDAFVPDEHFVIERPGVRFAGRPKGSEFRPQDGAHLVDSIYHAEILIHVSSSIGIDSLAFDKPQIMLEFDGWESKDYIESVERFHHETHMAKFVRTGAASIVRSPAALFESVRRYLQNPGLDAEGRREAARQLIWKMDGQSGRRVGEHIVTLLRSP